MDALTDEQRERLKHNLDSVTKAQKKINDTVAEFGLPEAYVEFNALFDRQIQAINNLLDSRELGCGIETLQFSAEEITVKQHIRNLAFLSEQALKLPEDDRDDFFEVRQIALHEIKRLASVASQTIQTIERIVDPRRVNSMSGQDKQWTH